VRVDAFAIRLRTRNSNEAADLGLRLCQATAGPVYRCYLPVLAVIVVLGTALSGIAVWLPSFFIWMAKPWMDRTILFVLSRAAFGQTTSPRDVWLTQRQVWWAQFFRTWTWRRLSPWRSYTQPVYQLEGLRGSQLRKRLSLIRSGKTAAALGVTCVFSCVETSFTIGLFSLIFWLAPKGFAPDWQSLFAGGNLGTGFNLATTTAYVTALAFVEPFFVAAGFAMYLNRRVQMEAWDIEQEFRRAFPQ